MATWQEDCIDFHEKSARLYSLPDGAYALSEPRVVDILAAASWSYAAPPRAEVLTPEVCRVRDEALRDGLVISAPELDDLQAGHTAARLARAHPDASSQDIRDALIAALTLRAAGRASEPSEKAASRS